MKMFKVYTPDEAEHHLIFAPTPFRAAQIARTVWEEAGNPQGRVKVVELCLPADGAIVGLIYEPNTTPVEYPKGKQVKTKRFDLSFTAQGYIKQTVEITNPKYTPKKVIAMLNAGEAATTVQEGGVVEIVATGEIIGKVVNVDNNLEYEEYDAD